MDFDIIINNATIVDGTGAQAIAPTSASSMARSTNRHARDATAAHVSATGGRQPGFIDIHPIATTTWTRASHEDKSGKDPTIVAGNCGSSGWPVSEHLDKVDAMA